MKGFFMAYIDTYNANITLYFNLPKNRIMRAKSIQSVPCVTLRLTTMYKSPYIYGQLKCNTGNTLGGCISMKSL